MDIWSILIEKQHAKKKRKLIEKRECCDVANFAYATNVHYCIADHGGCNALHFRFRVVSPDTYENNDNHWRKLIIAYQVCREHTSALLVALLL